MILKISHNSSLNDALQFKIAPQYKLGFFQAQRSIYKQCLEARTKIRVLLLTGL